MSNFTAASLRPLTPPPPTNMAITQKRFSGQGSNFGFVHLVGKGTISGKNEENLTPKDVGDSGICWIWHRMIQQSL